MRWCREQSVRPVAAREVLNNWAGVAERVATQREDQHAAMLNDLLTTLSVDPELSDDQERNLVACIDALPRDLRFGLVKSLVRIPPIAERLCKDEYDSVILEAMTAISREAG